MRAHVMFRLGDGRLEAALQRAGDGVFVVGDDGRIVFWNRAAERILGHAAREVVGRPCCDVFAGHDDAGNRLCYQGCHVMSLVRLAEPVQTFDMRTRTRAGRAIWLSISILRLPSPGTGAGLTVHLCRDVTATKELLTLVHERLTPARPAAGSDPAALLTRREVEVLRLMTDGVNTAEAARRLHVSTATVRNHVQNILGKLGVHSRLEAMAYATRHRLL